MEKLGLLDLFNLFMKLSDTQKENSEKVDEQIQEREVKEIEKEKLENPVKENKIDFMQNFFTVHEQATNRIDKRYKK